MQNKTRDTEIEKLKIITKTYYDKMCLEFMRKVTSEQINSWYRGLDPKGDEKEVKKQVDFIFTYIYNEYLHVARVGPNRRDFLMRSSEEKYRDDITRAEERTVDQNSTLEGIFKSLRQNPSQQVISRKIGACKELLRALDNGDIVACKEITGNVKKQLETHRNPGWNRFLTAISIVLFPLAIARALHSKATHGTFDFTKTDGGTVSGKFKRALDNIQNEEEKKKELRDDESSGLHQ